VFVIEVNDNPNIDAGVEDAVLKDDLYRLVMQNLIRRIEHRMQPPERVRNGAVAFPGVPATVTEAESDAPRLRPASCQLMRQAGRLRARRSAM
jgi:hypothetical protein